MIGWDHYCEPEIRSKIKDAGQGSSTRAHLGYISLIPTIKYLSLSEELQKIVHRNNQVDSILVAAIWLNNTCVKMHNLFPKDCLSNHFQTNTIDNVNVDVNWHGFYMNFLFYEPYKMNILAPSYIYNFGCSGQRTSTTFTILDNLVVFVGTY